MTRPKARAGHEGAEATEDISTLDAAADNNTGGAGAGTAAKQSAAMQRAAELTQRRVNLEDKLRDIDHMVRSGAVRVPFKPAQMVLVNLCRVSSRRLLVWSAPP